MPFPMKLIVLILLTSSVIGEARKHHKYRKHYHTKHTRRRPNLSYPSPKGCNRQCGSIFSQVCGSNGRTYNNKCLLELDACERDTTIQVVKEGSCIPSVTTTTTTQPPYIQPAKDPTTPENTFGVVVCKRTEFTCTLDETCIPYFKRCDGKPDCSDGQARILWTRVITGWHLL